MEYSHMDTLVLNSFPTKDYDHLGASTSLTAFFCQPRMLIYMFSYSSDAIERAWQILEKIPGRATGAYSHSQVHIYTHSLGCDKCHHVWMSLIIYVAILGYKRFA
jgi:hypothetical protein